MDNCKTYKTIIDKNNEGYSLKSIARFLNASAFPPPSGKSHWTAVDVYCVIGPRATIEDASLRIAVIILCTSNDTNLAKCIESVLSQSLPATEVLVAIDNCSDESYQIARQYPVKVIVTEICDRHILMSYAIKQVQSGLICFVDSNSTLHAEFFAKGGQLLLNEEIAIALSQDFDMESHAILEHSFIRRSFLDKINLLKRINNNDVKENLNKHNLTFANCSVSNQISKPIKIRPKIRIGFITPNFERNGVNVLWVQQVLLARELEWIGIHVFSKDKFAEIEDRIVPNLSLQELVEKSDVIYACFLEPQLAKEIRSMTDKPIIYGIHSLSDWYRNNVIETADCIDAYWCISYTAALMIPSHLRHKCRISYLGSDVDLAISNKLKEEVRLEYNHNPNEIIVGYIGRLTGEKNPVVVAEAVAKMPNAKLFCFSPHAFDEDNLFHGCIQEILQDRVIWSNTDYMALSDFFKIVDCIVISSYYESGPMVLIEAMAGSCPIVTTPGGIIAEMQLKHGKLAYIVNRGPSPDEIASAIHDLLNEKNIDDMIDKARDIAVCEFNNQKAVCGFEKIAEQAYLNYKNI